MKNIAKLIDQTYLNKKASQEDVRKIARQARQYGFRGFCVFPKHIKAAKETLGGTGIKVTALIDEPTGASAHGRRMEMVKEAKAAGSDEADVVMKIDDFKNKKYDEVLADLKEICQLLPVKVIIGSGYLTDEEIKKASQMVREAGAICVKTATIDDPLDKTELPEKAKHVKIMRQSAHGLLVKAAGSIRSAADLEMMVEAGADIIGTSSGAEIVDESEGIKNEEIKDDRVIE